ncbi:unnamed protein product [Lathyrus oleraceus]|uniref:Uncharacterized protein n=1 Tax=Pisum sativum TaxID=3888 RepID=A0A9D4VX10_PEA|nr:protein PHOTOSYSTEM I ASSEMBLY 2, chloroplastic [Pisum sativum]KAI5391226.1 hypothetical protein KIW84_076172 [Pisum sativum]
MSFISVCCCNGLVAPLSSPINLQAPLQPLTLKRTTVIASASKSGGGLSLNSIFKSCKNCEGKGAIQCPGCKGTGKNKKNGNIFERWKCFGCQGFGLIGCPNCGKGGLTPEQRGER